MGYRLLASRYFRRDAPGGQRVASYYSTGKFFHCCKNFLLHSSGPDLNNERPYRLFDDTVWKSKKPTFSDVLFSLKISVESKKKVFGFRDEAPHFFQGPRPKPAKPIGKSGPGTTLCYFATYCIQPYN